MKPDISHESEGDSHLLAPVKEGDLLADKYVVGRVLGVGGMGVVVAAHDESLDREVAIKFLLPRLAWSENSVQRFLREARAATRITSEHVVKLLEIDKLPSGVPFFVMEYLAGQDLKSVLGARGPLPVEEAVDYLLQSLQAVAEGHTKGVVHRDLKPANLFLTQRADGTPLIKVLDFGVAKMLRRERAEHSNAITNTDDVLLGSPSYMSPEQLLNPREVDERSDIWSLGVTLYEMLSGKLPFDGDSKFALMTNIMQASGAQLEAPPDSGRLPDQLVTIVWRCLQKQREDRFPNARELARALAPFGGEDARISLRRIHGLGSTPPKSKSTPPIALESVRAISTTLPVESTDSLARDETTGQPITRRFRRAWWLVLGSALLALGIGAPWLVPSQRDASPLPAAAASPVAGLVSAQAPAIAMPTVSAVVASVAAPPQASSPRDAGAGSKHRRTRLADTAPVASLKTRTGAATASSRPPARAIEALIQQRR
jgi:serine/threonine-protein kinase